MPSTDEALKRGESSDRTQNDSFYDGGTPSEGRTEIGMRAHDHICIFIAGIDTGLLAHHKTKRTINFNPTEGEVHDRERNRPWRIEVNQKTALANQRAEEEQWEKRRVGLAKQVGQTT
jgi:hypothetical protein